MAVGKIKSPLKTVASAYERRAGFYWSIRVAEVADGGSGDPDPNAVREAEASRLRRACSDGSVQVALTRSGSVMGSRELATWMDRRRTGATQEVAFLIGGAWGLAPDLVAEADATLSLSRMTLPHDLARVVLLEQVYRAGTILRGEPYHKGQG